MHDEVSETENIRKNLAIERMIIEGCEILLDTSQTFVRQGMPCLPGPGRLRSRGRQPWDIAGWCVCRVTQGCWRAVGVASTHTGAGTLVSTSSFFPSGPACLSYILRNADMCFLGRG